MSQQINLYEDRLRPRHELATGKNLVAGAVIVLVVMAALSIWTHMEASRVSEDAASIQKALTGAQEKLTTLSKQTAERKVSPALANERDSIKSVLAQQREIMNVLESGALGRTTGFATVMTGFARQTTHDLWLTGFSVTMGGDEIEIHGRTLDPSRLPIYVQSLSNENAFRGRRFAALEMHDVEPGILSANTASTGAPATGQTGTQAPSTDLPRFVEFALRSANIVVTDVARGGVKP